MSGIEPQATAWKTRPFPLDHSSTKIAFENRIYSSNTTYLYIQELMT